MDVNARIRRFMTERGWTEYRLAKSAKLPQSTVANLFRRNTIPSVATLEIICDALGITLAQFFAEGDLVELASGDQRAFFDQWLWLNQEQKKALCILADVMRR